MNRYKKAYDVIDTILHLMCGEKREDGYEPDGKINRKEEKEMKRTFRLRKKNFNFDKKGMILKGVVSNDGRIFVRAWDIYI